MFCLQGGGRDCPLFRRGVYRRPATPPVFNLETSLASLDRLMPLKASWMCYGHFGYRPSVTSALQEARDQLLLWVAVARQHLGAEPEVSNTEIIATLKKTDAAFALMDCLDEDIQQREIYFTGNSLNGIREYIRKEIAHPTKEGLID